MLLNWMKANVSCRHCYLELLSVNCVIGTLPMKFLQIDNILIFQVKIWKIVYLNCKERHEVMIDHRSYIHNLNSCEIKTWKTFLQSTLPVSKRSWLRIPFKPEFFKALISQLFNLYITVMIRHVFIRCFLIVHFHKYIQTNHDLVWS